MPIRGSPMKKRFLDVERQLREQGIRLTPQRQLIVRRAAAHLHFTAEQLVRDVRAAITERLED